MATAIQKKQPKRNRMDLRLEDRRKELYERAAALKGQTISQWSLSHLDDAAARDIEEARVTRLSDEAFEKFVKLLEEPMPKAAAELLESEPIWV